MKMLHVTIQTLKFEEEMNFFLNHVGLKIERDMRPMGRNMVFLANVKFFFLKDPAGVTIQFM